MHCVNHERGTETPRQMNKERSVEERLLGREIGQEAEEDTSSSGVRSEAGSDGPYPGPTRRSHTLGKSFILRQN